MYAVMMGIFRGTHRERKKNRSNVKIDMDFVEVPW